MEHFTSRQKVSRAFERVQEWLGARDFKHWLWRIRPDTSLPSQREKQPDFESPNDANLDDLDPLNPDTGPTEAELSRMEQGEIPLRFEVQDLDDTSDIVQPTAQEEEHPVHEEHEIEGSRTGIGEELAERMIRSATSNEQD